MDKHPVPAARRRRLEAAIRVIDLIVYAAVFSGGVYALFATPSTVEAELAGVEWLIVMWAVLLLLGGAVGFAGRLSRWWMVEVPAAVLSISGILIYLVVLGRFAFTSITAAVAAVLVAVSMLMIVRRWVELQIFSIDPDHPDFRSRLAEALRRRTPNFHRHS